MAKRLVSRLLGMFQSRTQVGVDKAGNRYFTRVEEVDGAGSCPHPFPAFLPSHETFKFVFYTTHGCWLISKSCSLLMLVPLLDGTVKGKRWVEFKGTDQDPTTVPGDQSPFSFGWCRHVPWPKDFPNLTDGAPCFCRHVWIIHIDSEMICFVSSGECSESHSSVVSVVEWICWLNGQRKKAPTPEVRSRMQPTPCFCLANHGIVHQVYNTGNMFIPSDADVVLTPFRN
jgi:hypothetical protein